MESRANAPGRRYGRRLALLTVALVLLAPLGLHVRNRMHFDVSAFDAGAARALTRTRALEERARRFDPDQALAALAPLAANGFSFRFDDALATATVIDEAPEEGFAEEDSVSPFRPEPVGHESIALGDEQRLAIHVLAPRTLRYELALPAEPAALTLSAGLAVLGATPVTFTVTVVASGEAHVLLERTSSTPETWDDVEVDLTAFRGQRVEVHLTTRSPAPSVAFWSNPVLRGPRERPVNVLVVLEDTLRADHLSTYGHPRATSPAKDALAREGVVFERAYSQATKTRPSCPALMTSLYPTAGRGACRQQVAWRPSLTLFGLRSPSHPARRRSWG
jgi:hypothetical protein